MRFAIVGAGAIGAYVGAALHRGGSDVVLIARGEHLRAMRRGGLAVRSPAGDFHVDAEATDDLAAVAGADVAILALKAYSLPEVAPGLAGHLPAVVVAAQNGIPWWYFEAHDGGHGLAGTHLESVDPGGAVAAAIPADRTVGCVVYSSAEMAEPGVVRHIEGARFIIGEPDGTRSERCAAIAERFIAAGLECPVVDDIRAEMWLKLIGNVPFNLASALTGATLAGLGATADMRAVLRASMQECAGVAARLGITLPTSIDRRLEAAFAVGEHKTSMLQDLQAGKPLETGCLSGAVLELAGRLGVPAPATKALHACVELLAERQG